MFDTEGSATCIHSSGLDPIIRAVGASELHRASHIEPYECLTPDLQLRVRIVLNRTRESLLGKWFADLRKSGGDIEGPMDSREEALAFEIQWVKQNVLRLPDAPS